MMHEYTLTVDLIRGAVETLDAREPMSGLSRIVLWLDVREARDDLNVVLGQIEADATDALVEILRESGDDALEVPGPDGPRPVHLERKRPADRWNGYRLLGALSRNVIDPDSRDVFPAVDLGVLRDVIPASSKDDWTYQKFLYGGVRRHGIDARRYVERGDPIDVIRPGWPR